VENFKICKKAVDKRRGAPYNGREAVMALWLFGGVAVPFSLKSGGPHGTLKIAVRRPAKKQPTENFL